ncbi:hypothetical protein M6B38_228495 [Iris pallida]|uniref:Uncharacterized protein n=1 Tax=Iris pallida TaxID=29817 RepID=A0AAX6DT11_IRIPA|nr:hypothetical protein M6B38_228495 [Iris pallida]
MHETFTSDTAESTPCLVQFIFRGYPALLPTIDYPEQGK